MGNDLFAIVLSIACVAISFEVRRRTLPLFPKSANTVICAALAMTILSVAAILSPVVAWPLMRDIMFIAFIVLSAFLLYWKSRYDRDAL